jgi:hypothetical protein
MRSAACIAVDVVDLDEADVAVALGEFAQLTGGEHGFCVGARDFAGGDGAVFPDDFVAQAFDALDAVVSDGATGEIDGGNRIAEVERDGGNVELAQEDSREQMLASMLLHVVETALPVDVAVDLCAKREGLADEVPDLALVVFFYGIDGNIERGSSRRDCAKDADVIGLTPAGGVKGSAVEGDLPDGFAFRSGELPDVHDRSRERFQERIGVIKPLGCGHSLTPHLALAPARSKKGQFRGQARFSVMREHPTVSNYSRRRC